MPIDTRDPLSIRTLDRGRCYLYVMPCVFEDLLKLGHSRDPLERLISLHRRWFDLFDPDRALLVETDSVREAQALERELHRELALFNAPAPLTVSRQAGGAGEWYRGAYARLFEAVHDLGASGHTLHVPAREWLRNALLRRADLLYAWTQAMLTPDELEGRWGLSPSQQAVGDVLDAFAALTIDVEPWIPGPVAAWYRSARPNRADQQ